MFKLITLISVLFISSFIIASPPPPGTAPTAPVYYVSVGTTGGTGGGNWSDNGTWARSTVSYGEALALAISGVSCDCSPILGYSDAAWQENVTIQNGHTVTQTDEMIFLGELTILFGGTLSDKGDGNKFTVALYHPSSNDATAEDNGGYGNRQAGVEPKVSGVFGITTNNHASTVPNKFGRVFNYGTWINNLEVNSDGYFYNGSSGVCNFSKLHSDWYTCNSGLIVATIEIKMHGGMTDCCGDMYTASLKFDTQSNNKGYTYFTENEDGMHYYAEGSHSPFPYTATLDGDEGFNPSTGTWNSMNTASVQPDDHTFNSYGNSIVVCQNYCGIDGITYPTISPVPGTYANFFNPGYSPARIYVDNFTPYGGVEPVTFCSFGILPIELINFNVRKVENANVEVSWMTASERDNDYFTVLRSVDGINWEEIKVVDGAGNSDEVLDYAIIDRPLQTGTIYYRLRQTDINGASEEFEVKSVNISGLGFDLIVYPNPAENSINLISSERLINNALVYNVIGELVNSRIQTSIISDKKIQLEISNLDAGIYTVIVGENTARFIKK